MYNNLFIDPMEKTNKLAKGKGFVNGVDWAKAAKNAGEIHSLDLAEFEKCHNLRNLIAHGSATDITISAETLAATFSFLSALEKTKVEPTVARETHEKFHFSPNLYPQEWDFVIVPFFQGVIDPRTGESAVKEESILYMEELPEAVYFQDSAGIISSMEEQVLTGYFMYDKDKKPHHDPKVCKLRSTRDLDITHIRKSLPRYYNTSSSRYHGIVLRPDTKLKLAMLAAKEPLYTSAYTLCDDKVSFTMGVKRDDGRGAYLVDFITGQNDLQTYTCRGYLVPLGYLLGGIPIEFDGGESAKLKDNMFLSFPPALAMPYHQWWCKYNINGKRRPQLYEIQQNMWWEKEDDGLPF